MSGANVGAGAGTGGGRDGESEGEEEDDDAAPMAASVERAKLRTRQVQRRMREAREGVLKLKAQLGGGGGEGEGGQGGAGGDANSGGAGGAHGGAGDLGHALLRPIPIGRTSRVLVGCSPLVERHLALAKEQRHLERRERRPKLILDPPKHPNADPDPSATPVALSLERRPPSRWVDAAARSMAELERDIANTRRAGGAAAEDGGGAGRDEESVASTVRSGASQSSQFSQFSHASRATLATNWTTKRMLELTGGVPTSKRLIMADPTELKWYSNVLVEVHQQRGGPETKMTHFKKLDKFLAQRPKLDRTLKRFPPRLKE